MRSVRLALGMTQVEMSQLLGKSLATIQGYEAGKRLPGEVDEQLRRIASERGFGNLVDHVPKTERRLICPHCGSVTYGGCEHITFGTVPPSVPRTEKTLKSETVSGIQDIREENENVHRQLEFILQHAEAKVADFIRGNIRVFHEHTHQHARPSGTSGGKGVGRTDRSAERSPSAARGTGPIDRRRSRAPSGDVQ